MNLKSHILLFKLHVNMQTTENNRNNSKAFRSIFVRMSSYLSNIMLLSMLSNNPIFALLNRNVRVVSKFLCLYLQTSVETKLKPFSRFPIIIIISIDLWRAKNANDLKLWAIFLHTQLLKLWIPKKTFLWSIEYFCFCMVTLIIYNNKNINGLNR